MSSKLLSQNPLSPAPETVLRELEVLKIRHYGFNNLFHSGEIIVHKDVIDDVKKFFKLASEIKFPIYSVVPIHKEPFFFDDIKSCEENNSSAFNYRKIHNTQTLSKHSLGKAFDINPVQNIYLTYNEAGGETFRLPSNALYDETAPGTLTARHPLVVFMKSRSWTWGGDWTPESGRIDYQHFEKI